MVRLALRLFDAAVVFTADATMTASAFPEYAYPVQGRAHAATTARR